MKPARTGIPDARDDHKSRFIDIHTSDRCERAFSDSWDSG